MAKLGTQLSESQLKSAVPGAPPIVLSVQATSYLRLEKSEDLKQWEKDLQDFYGIKSITGIAGAASESCSGGGSDGCDVLQ